MITGIILAGGSSRRMGQDKALMPLKGRPIIEHVSQAMETVCDQIIIVAQAHQDFSFLGKPVVYDIIPGFGALMGIFTGLKAADTNRALAVACDMPFVRPALLRHLTIAAPEADVVVPRINGHLEPLLAVYSKRCLGPIEKMIRHSEKYIYGFFPEVDVREIQQKELELLDPGLRSIININSQEDLVKVTGGP